MQLVMEPCTILMDHTHGQTEFSVVASGTPTVGVVYTDASGTTQLYNATGAPGSYLVVPPNLLHFISNDACTQATVFAVFNQAVFDVYFYPFTMSFIPENVFQAAYGFSTANDASKLQQQASARDAVLAPLSLECYARCNLNPPAAEPMTAAKSG